MNIGILIPIVGILASAWVAVTLIKFWSKDEGKGQAAIPAQDSHLAAENARLQRNVEKLEERLAVLERIATDPAERTAREIENLR